MTPRNGSGRAARSVAPAGRCSDLKSISLDEAVEEEMKVDHACVGIPRCKDRKDLRIARWRGRFRNCWSLWRAPTSAPGKTSRRPKPRSRTDSADQRPMPCKRCTFRGASSRLIRSTRPGPPRRMRQRRRVRSDTGLARAEAETAEVGNRHICHDTRLRERVRESAGRWSPGRHTCSPAGSATRYRPRGSAGDWRPRWPGLRNGREPGRLHPQERSFRTRK